MALTAFGNIAKLQLYKYKKEKNETKGCLDTAKI